MITDKELYSYFIDTLSHCGLFILDKDIEDIEYEIFEEFDIGVISFLHDNSLKQLLDAGLININIYKNCHNLREEVLNIQANGLWQINFVKKDKDWYKILLMSDKIKNEIEDYQRASAR
ncbi:hypothetical protein AR438_17130 [Chryseobacterium aquaticum]|uniref:Uncharacterized protein n=1 Tax=Chryseobacterium aquaticum TaxID=452084 RepID=A0A0Q3HNI6_9FLAO|nr:hypothetical protein [Chryseobacterium aquaticum]KQK24352.1 hypothetical protein AR438_17130 [Chryseobacterium aquaticum]